MLSVRQKRKRIKRIRQTCARIGILCTVLCAIIVFIRFFAGRSALFGKDYYQTGSSTQTVQQSKADMENIQAESGETANHREGSGTTGYAGIISENYDENWNLILVNPWNELPEDFEISLTTVYGNYQVDSRCYEELTEMLADCEAAGLSPMICSAYRTMEKQESLYQEKVDELLRQGLTMSEAQTEAAASVAVPGTSEHQLGLAVDIVDSGYQLLLESQENTPVQQWLIDNSWKYGFILRYPKDKTELTGIIYEPWHYRYVGKEAAKEIYDRNLCLEEYLAEMDE